jgi:thiopeptide-type bacteriocin biosynthesis protein
MAPARLTDAGFFVFRLPLLSVDAFLQEGSSDWQAPLDRPEFRAAIQLQSPSLSVALDRTPTVADAARIRRALYRYTSRAALRSSPRGLFAAVAMGHVDDSTQLRADGADGSVAHVELSLDYLSALADHQFGPGTGHRAAELCLNPTLLQRGDTIVLWEARRLDPRPHLRPVVLQASPLLRRLVTALGPGGMSRRRVRTVLHAAGVPDHELHARLAELCGAQILTHAHGVQTVAADPVGQFLERLPDGRPRTPLRQTLADVRARARRQRRSPRTFSVPALEELRSRLPNVPGFEHANHVFQVETCLRGHPPTLTKTLLGEIAYGIERLHFAFGDMHVGRLAPFIEAFIERFGEATVPLSHVVDPEGGLGAIVLAKTAPPAWAGRGRRAAMLRLVHGALAQQQGRVVLDASFWGALLPADLPPLPPAVSAVCQLFAASPGAVDAGAYEVALDCVVGTTGAELWSRHVRVSAPLRAAIDALRARLGEEDLGAVRADVMFTPVTGADVMSRPPMAPLRIDCTATASLTDRSTLPLGDLFLQIRHGRMRLVSKRLLREVQPIIGCVIDPEVVRSPLFSLLSLLASQGYATPLAWQWGELSESPFLPRVCLGRLVMVPARWRVHDVELRALRRSDKDRQGRDRWTRWRIQRGIPRCVSLRLGEDGVGCDLDRAVGRELLMHEASRRGLVSLDELRIGDAELCVSDGRERYAHELVVPFVRDVDVGAAGRRRPVEHTAATSSTWAAKFADGVKLPGSEWVYAKLYSSPRGIQAMLRGAVAKLVTRLRRECNVKDWFFFRYPDPDWHLRLRVRAPERAQQEDVRRLIESTCRLLKRRESVWRLEYDTYFREIERFGGSRACGYVERLFTVESELALCAFDAWGDSEASRHQAMSLAIAWTWWSWLSLGLTPVDAAAVARALRSGLVQDRRITREQTRACRVNGAEPLRLSGGDWRAFTVRAGRILDRLRQSADARDLGVDRHELAGDLSHLFVNRLFAARHAECEFGLYGALERHAHRAAVDRAAPRWRSPIGAKGRR